MTASVTGDLSMISATAFMSKSEATRRTFFSASWTPTLMTKVRGFTRWPEAAPARVVLLHGLPDLFLGTRPEVLCHG